MYLRERLSFCTSCRRTVSFRTVWLNAVHTRERIPFLSLLFVVIWTNREHSVIWHLTKHCLSKHAIGSVKTKSIHCTKIKLVDWFIAVELEWTCFFATRINIESKSHFHYKKPAQKTQIVRNTDKAKYRQNSIKNWHYLSQNTVEQKLKAKMPPKKARGFASKPNFFNSIKVMKAILDESRAGNEIHLRLLKVERGNFQYNVAAQSITKRARLASSVENSW